MSSFPTVNDTLTNPASTDTLDNPSHSDQHTDANDAIEAIQTVMSTQPVGVIVYQSATHASTSGVTTTELFDAETYDPYGFHSTTTNTNRLTVPTGLGGVYMVTAQLTWAAHATDVGTRHLLIRKNGTSVARAQAATATTDRTQIIASWPIELAAGDYVDIGGIQDSGDALTMGFANAELGNKLAMFRL